VQESLESITVRLGTVDVEKFRVFARQLRATGQGGLLRELTKAMRAEAAPIQRDMRLQVRGLSTTGSRGGASARADRAEFLLRRRKNITEKARLRAHRASRLRDFVARSVQFQARTTKKDPAIRISASRQLMPAGQRGMPRALNNGVWRHPVFGDRERWVTQRVAPGAWFDDPARRDGPRARDRILAIVSTYINRSFD